MNYLTLLRLEHVLERRGRSRAQTYREIHAGFLTPPIRTGNAKIAVWPAHEINALIRAEIGGANRTEICELVRELVRQRTAGRPAPTTSAETA